MANEFIDTAKRPSVYFYHIPKTGGMSLRSFLADQYQEDERCPAIDWADLARTPRAKLRNFRLFYGHLSANLADFLPAGVKTFTFLRDPVERTISTIRHTLRDPDFHPLHEMIRGLSLREVIYNDAFMATLRNSQTALLSCDVPPEEIFARALKAEEEGRRFELGEMTWAASPAKALARLDSFDFVGLMDRFPESMLGLCHVFKYLPPEAMPELNRAPDDFARDLDARDIEHVASFLADDMLVYAQAKEKFRAGESRQALIAELMSEGVLKSITAPSDIHLGAPFAGSGWYEPEMHPRGLLRWSGPHPTAKLYLPIDRSEKRAIRLRLWRKHGLDEVDVSVEGEKVAVRKSDDGGILNVEVDLPMLPEGGVKLMTLVVDSKFVLTPAERGGDDLKVAGGDAGVLIGQLDQ